MSLVFFGDSHAHALIRAMAKQGDYEGITSVDVRRTEGAANSKNIPENLAENYPADAVFCGLGGTEHNLLGLIESSQPFDFLGSADDTLLPDRRPVPNGIVRSALASRTRSAFGRMQAVREQYNCPVTYVAPPPPVAHIEDTANLPRAFVPHLEKGIAPATVRRKLYQVQIDLLQEHCRSIGVQFMAAPDEACDSCGYLLREFWDNDPTHGNYMYGAAVIGQMKALQFA